LGVDKTSVIKLGSSDVWRLHCELKRTHQNVFRQTLFILVTFGVYYPE